MVSLSQKCEIHFPLVRDVDRMAGPIRPCSENELNTVMYRVGNLLFFQINVR